MSVISGYEDLKTLIRNNNNTDRLRNSASNGSTNSMDDTTYTTYSVNFDEQDILGIRAEENNDNPRSAA